MLKYIGNGRKIQAANVYGYYGLNCYEEAIKLDKAAYLQMQAADYVLNNDDRHRQNST